MTHKRDIHKFTIYFSMINGDDYIFRAVMNTMQREVYYTHIGNLFETNNKQDWFCVGNELDLMGYYLIDEDLNKDLFISRSHICSFTVIFDKKLASGKEKVDDETSKDEI